MKKKTVLILSVFWALAFLTACVKKEQASIEAVEGSETCSALDSLIFAPLYQYVRENVTLMGTFLHRPSVLYDVTGDGTADLCASVTTGSGIVSTLVVVYDVQNQRGYMINDRMKFDYHIQGIEDGQLVVKRTMWGDQEKETTGTIRLEGDEIAFQPE
ncbi:MAG: hypothetical protein J6O53_07795 [Eubacterium sp.]|nr:hypothetical protein [Eubacterium sp.]